MTHLLGHVGAGGIFCPSDATHCLFSSCRQSLCLCLHKLVSGRFALLGRKLCTHCVRDANRCRTVLQVEIQWN